MDETAVKQREVAGHIWKLADMTLRDLVELFGTDVAFKDWLDALKRIEDIRASRIKNAKLEGELVSREIVQRFVMEPVETAHVGLLTDGAKTMARIIVPMVQSGSMADEIEKYISNTITKYVKRVKAKTAQLVELSNKDNDVAIQA
jgi:hypothetical protein